MWIRPIAVGIAFKIEDTDTFFAFRILADGYLLGINTLDSSTSLYICKTSKQVAWSSRWQQVITQTEFTYTGVDLSCHSDCTTCDQADICLTRNDANAVPSATTGCECADQYFYDSTIYA